MPKAKRKSPAGKGHNSPYKTRRTKCSPASHPGDPERLPLAPSDACGSNAGAHLTHPLNTEMIPAGPASSSPSQPQAFGSFFQNSSNVSINGGEFTSSQLHHTNLTINIGGSVTAGSDDSFETNVISVGGVQSYGKRNGPLDSASQETSHMQENSGNIYEGNHMDSSDHEASGLGYARDSGWSPYSRQESRLLPPLPIQKSSDIYFRHLATKGRGSPLWNPEPNSMLPIEYQRHGTGIGDVGIITDSGGFDFLFNVCLPEGDPINPETMPLNFTGVSEI